jgi:hypothetical protein
MEEDQHLRAGNMPSRAPAWDHGAGQNTVDESESFCVPEEEAKLICFQKARASLVWRLMIPFPCVRQDTYLTFPES